MKANTPETEQRRLAICEWLTTNGINPAHVPEESALSVLDHGGQRTLHYEAFVLTADGSKQVDPQDPDRVWTEPRTQPCTVEPPSWLHIAGTNRP